MIEYDINKMENCLLAHAREPFDLSELIIHLISVASNPKYNYLKAAFYDMSDIKEFNGSYEQLGMTLKKFNLSHYPHMTEKIAIYCCGNSELATIIGEFIAQSQSSMFNLQLHTTKESALQWIHLD